MTQQGSDREAELTDPDRLMEGEDPGSTVLEDAEHWLGVYAELLGFKDRLLDEAETATAELSPPAQEEGGRDLDLLDAEKERLERRFRFWRERVRELGSRH